MVFPQRPVGIEHSYPQFNRDHDVKSWAYEFVFLIFLPEIRYAQSVSLLAYHITGDRFVDANKI